MTDQDRIAWLIAEVERLRPDAERWQYVRKHPHYFTTSDGTVESWLLTGAKADAAVDAARKAT